MATALAECLLVQEDQEATKCPIDSYLKNTTTKSREEIFSELAKINGIINKMDKVKLVEKLELVHLNTEGATVTLKKRLKNFYRKKKLSRKLLGLSTKLYPYYVVIDFEATCQEINGPNYLHEIIEFPAVLVSSEKEEIVDEFHSYCKPTVDPTLSSFCTELTGITQKQVDEAKPFLDVLKNFEEWLIQHNLGVTEAFAFVTDGPWDMGRFFDGQCKISKIRYPRYAKRWVNLRKTFSNFYKCKRFSLNVMLSHLGMTFEGRPHCGLDDSRNIAQVLLRLIADGASIQMNEKINWSKQDKSVSHVVPIQPSEKMPTIIQVRKVENKLMKARLASENPEDPTSENAS